MLDLALEDLFLGVLGLPAFLAGLELWDLDFLDLVGFGEKKQVVVVHLDLLVLLILLKSLDSCDRDNVTYILPW